VRPKKTEKLVSYTFRTTRDQIDFLRSSSNASEFIRKAIEHEKELTVNPLESERLRLIQQIETLETQISELTNHEAYMEAKEKLEEFQRVLVIHNSEEEKEKEEKTLKQDKRYYTAVIKSFEERIGKLEEEKQKLKEKLVTET